MKTVLLFAISVIFTYPGGGRSRVVVDKFHPAPRVSAQNVPDLYPPIDWDARANDELKAALSNQPKVAQAKNVILFIGDGMGVSTQTAARIFSAQNITSEREEDGTLSWEEFPYTGLIKTYNTDRLTPDSAGTATAFMCGQKAQFGTVGVRQTVRRGDCQASVGNEQYSFINQAITEGMWTGVVTTTRITHATPAAAFAHVAERDWEHDAAVPPADRSVCRDIAHQLVHGDNNTRIRVILGGGRENFISVNVTDPEYPSQSGLREDDRNLIQEWKDLKAEQSATYAYVDKQSAFDQIDVNNVDYILGLFEPGHMKYEAEREHETPGAEWNEPSLTDMVTKAIGLLKRSDKGYALLVEGGRVDHAHHESNAARSLRDAVALSDAVRQAATLTSADDTLIILTADHSHTFVLGGYPDIRRSIFGRYLDDKLKFWSNIVTEDNVTVLVDDGLPYLALSYANGPGAYTNRSDLLRDQSNGTLGSTGYIQNSLVPKDSETHGGEDVAVYARGPFAHLMTGLHEQNYIAHVVNYATCLGSATYCDTVSATSAPIESNGNHPTAAILQNPFYLAFAWFFATRFVKY